jgi:hypothetical protein
MGVAGVLVLGVMVAAMAIGGLVAKLRRDDRRQRWVEFARLRGLHAGGGPVGRLYGAYERTVVSLTEEQRGSGKSRHTVTCATAFFSMPMPDGLRVTPEGIRAGFAIAFGGQDIQIGVADADSALRIQATDEAATRELLGHADARRAIVDFVSRHSDSSVTQSRATFDQRGMVDDFESLDGMLREVVGVVRAVEAALAVDPAADARAGHAAAREPYPLPPGRLEPETGGPAGPPESLAAPEAVAPKSPVARPPAAVDALVAELSAGGRVDSAGSFTLDREAARAKLAQFRLRDPDEYVLALVRSAVLKGATRIDVTLDADDLRLSFDGRPFALADFEELYAALFADGEHADLRARRQLALAVTAAEATKPKFVRVVSGTGADAACFTLTPGERDRYERAADAAGGTTIHVKARLLAALGGRRGRIAGLLESRCAFTPIPLTLNGDLVSGGAGPTGAWGVVEIEGPGFHGLVGLDRDRRERQQIVWLADGVVAARHELDGWPRELTAVVEGSGRLKLDVSEGDVVRDAAHAEIVAAVRDALPRVYRRLGEQLAERPPSGGSDFPRLWATAVLRSVARGIPDAAAFQPGGPARWLAELPLFQDVELRDLSLAELLERAATGEAGRSDYALAGLGIHTESSGYDELSHRRTVWLGWRHDARNRAFLHRLLGDRLPSLNDRLLDCPRAEELLEQLTRWTRG